MLCLYFSFTVVSIGYGIGGAMNDDPRWRAIESVSNWLHAPRETYYYGVRMWMVRVVNAWRSNNTDGAFDPQGCYVFVQMGVGARTELTVIRYAGFNGFLSNDTIAIMLTERELCDLVPFETVPDSRRLKGPIELYMNLIPDENLDLLVFFAPKHDFQHLRLLLPSKAFSFIPFGHDTWDDTWGDVNYIGFVIASDILNSPPKLAGKRN
jgi:hypothetical protein